MGFDEWVDLGDQKVTCGQHLLEEKVYVDLNLKCNEKEIIVVRSVT